MELTEKLCQIQATINVAKNQKNTFGNYNYRSCEDILQALKPYTQELNVVVLLSDEIKELSNGWVFVEATATIRDVETKEEISVKSQAGIQERKGMDFSQTFGASSSYARKYALNGLFKLDDNKDADTNEFYKQTGKDKKEETLKVKETPKIAKNKGFQVEEKEIITSQKETPKNAEEIDFTEAFRNAIPEKDRINDLNDKDLPFYEEEKINVLEQLQDAIVSKCEAIKKNPIDCYNYYCKQFKVKSVDELDSTQLMKIANDLDEAIERRKGVAND